MSILHDYKFYQPEKIDKAVDLLDQYGKKAKLLAGGTDLVVQMKENVATPAAVIDIKKIDALSDIFVDDGTMFIGAAVTFTQLIESPLIAEYFPLLKQMSEKVASVGIRNRATLVGNICSAVPSADSAPALLVYAADVIAKSNFGTRLIPLDEWFTGPKQTSLESNELVTGITLNLPAHRQAGCYKKLGRYKGEDLAQAGISILVSKDYTYKIAFGAVGPVPKRARAVEAYLNGSEPSPQIIQKAKELLQEEISPLSDIRATKEYRSHMMNVMLERGLQEVVAALEGGKNA